MSRLRSVSRRRWLVLLAVGVLCLYGFSVAWRMNTTRPAPPSLNGFGVAQGPGAGDEDKLATLGVTWYTDFAFTGESIPGVTRLYMVFPSFNQKVLHDAAETARGQWWAIGNEPNDEVQDNLTPAAYARFFRDAQSVIRQGDKGAYIMPAGIANADWQYADRFREEYRTLTGHYPQVNAWNLHNYLLDEDGDPYDVGEFKRRIVAFRQWMNRVGEGAKPLYLTEFGVLYGAGCCDQPIDPPQKVVDFMVETVPWLARGDLVQGWAWFTIISGEYMFNGDLYDESGKLTLFGIAYRDLIHSERGSSARRANAIP